MAVVQLILSPEEDAMSQHVVCESVMQKELHLSSQTTSLMSASFQAFLSGLESVLED